MLIFTATVTKPSQQSLCTKQEMFRFIYINSPSTFLQVRVLYCISQNGIFCFEPFFVWLARLSLVIQ